MGNLEHEQFICIDCETTGLDPKEDRIIEIGAVCFSLNEKFHAMEALIDPERKISEESMKIHNITDEMVKGKPKISEVLPELLKLIGDKIIVGHGVGFDVQLLIHAAERASIPCKLEKNRILDTLRLARLYGECPVNSLEQLRIHFNIEEEGAHRAMSDVVVNVDVFKMLIKPFKNVNHIFQALEKPIKLKLMPLGKHKGRLMSDVPLDYLYWAAKLDFDQDLLYSIRSEIKRRKNGNTFLQASNPFSNL